VIHRLIPLLLVAVAVTGCHGKPAPTDDQGDGPPIVRVSAAPVRSVTAPRTVDGFGSLVVPPNHQSAVASAVGGRVLAIHARVGQRVAQGEILVDLQADPTAQADLAKARIMLEQTRRERDRQEALVKAGVAARMRYEDAESAYQAAKTDVALKEQAARLARQNAQLRAPISGVVTEASLSIGMVLPAQTPAMTVSDLHGMWAEVAIAPDDLPQIRSDQRARVTLSDGTAIVGRVVSVNRVVSPDTQRGSARIALESPPAGAEAGAFVRARIDVGQSQGLLVPSDSVVVRDGQEAVFVIQNGVAHLTPVHLGASEASGTVVTGPLQPGAPVVTTGAAELTDGASVSLEATKS
jgi:RND family efflux transporter MFP subunit